MFLYICSIYYSSYSKITIMFLIKELAKERNITLLQLAELVETTQPNISNIANNKSTPSIEMLQRIADALNVHISELFERPDNNCFKCPKCGTTLEIIEKK